MWWIEAESEKKVKSEIVKSKVYFFISFFFELNIRDKTGEKERESVCQSG